MGLILLEALLALALLAGIVWWTMFSGRTRGERPGAHPPTSPDAAAPAEPAPAAPAPPQPPPPP
jgi:hypothetical protein